MPYEGNTVNRAGGSGARGRPSIVVVVKLQGFPLRSRREGALLHA